MRLRSFHKKKPPTVKLEPSENVYSYFLFAVPMEEQRRPGRFGWNKLLAYTLVVSSIVLQAVLLYAIFNSVVAEDKEWRNSILDPRGERFIGSDLNLFASSSAGVCNKGGSLCFKSNGTYSCSPPSVQLTGRWAELDTNGDGIWTREEVQASQKELQCKYAVNPVEVFDVFVNFLLKREGIIWLHPDLREGKAIHKAYFTYAAGDIIMCSYRNVDACANLMQRGFFDAPLKFGTAPRVGKTIDSALDYCHALLEEGGICERSLPSTYAVWKKSSVKQCRSAKYDKFVYTHPVSLRAKSMLTVDYAARRDYKRAGQSSTFLMYKTVIVAIFLLAMLGELKEILVLFQWCCRYKVAESADSAQTQEEGEGAQDEEPDNVIHKISFHHRVTMAVFIAARFIMLLVLTWVGSMFLLKDTDYINLLLNSLGLIVVIEIIQNFYTFLISPELRQECEEMEPMAIPAMGNSYLNRRPALRDLIVIVVFVFTVLGLMYANHIFIVEPLSSALECACLSEGEHCFEKEAYSADFWAKYWTKDVPSVFREVDQLKAGTHPSISMLEEASSTETEVHQAKASISISLIENAFATEAAMNGDNPALSLSNSQLRKRLNRGRGLHRA